MSFDRRDFNNLLKNKAKERIVERKNELTYFVQAKIHADHVTNDPHWDRFLELIEFDRELAQKEHDSLLAKLGDPQCVDPQAMLLAKTNAARFQGQLEAYEKVMALPKQMQETGEKAGDLLDQLEERV